MKRGKIVFMDSYKNEKEVKIANCATRVHFVAEDLLPNFCLNSSLKMQTMRQ